MARMQTLNVEVKISSETMLAVMSVCECAKAAHDAGQDLGTTFAVDAKQWRALMDAIADLGFMAVYDFDKAAMGDSKSLEIVRNN